MGGAVDTVIQRIIEFLPLWMGLNVALPPQWPPLRVYFGITIILSMLELRSGDFVAAAR